VQVCLANGDGYGACAGCGALGSSGSTGSGGSSGASHSGSGTGSGSGSGDAGIVPDPTTCAQAEALKSYEGCEFWPTVTANVVWSGFDFAAVVANTQSVPASVTVTGPSGFTTTEVIPANGLTPIYLPWVPALKGPDVTATDMTFPSSISVPQGAYHLVSTVPVAVYQFNALEYQGVGGPPGKVWTGCPNLSATGGCFSYTNDASVLFPTAAMTGNYRVTGEHGSTLLGGGIIAITGTVDGTSVVVTLSSTAAIVASTAGDIPATAANGTLTLSLNAGDVVELVGTAADDVDLSGSLIVATNPVQVISARQCADQPDPMAACDHLESSVLPAETLGQDYVVTVPTSPRQTEPDGGLSSGATVIGHVVRFFGNVDGTVLTYSPAPPLGCPSTLNAGEVVECTGTPSCATGISNDGLSTPIPVTCVTTSFEVKGTHEFAVSSFMLGGSAVDPNAASGAQEGDPSMSPMVPVEEYRAKYTFLAPTDYEESYADIVAPTGVPITLDGNLLAVTPTVLNSSWSILRVELGIGHGGAHVLSASKGFGAQVIGYGDYTSYQYPAGFDLTHIASAPHGRTPPP
jgi:hypothetical protein